MDISPRKSSYTYRRGHAGMPGSYWRFADENQLQQKIAIDDFIGNTTIAEYNFLVAARKAKTDAENAETFTLKNYLNWRKIELFWTLQRLQTYILGTRLAARVSEARSVLTAEPPSILKHQLPKPADSWAPLRQPRIFVKCTQTFTDMNKSGIPRVMRNLAIEAAAAGEGIPVLFDADGETMVPLYADWLSHEKLEMQPGDTLLAPVWADKRRLRKAIRRARRCGASVALLIFDLIPIKYPATCNIDFEPVEWLDEFLPCADRILAISKSVALDVRRYLEAAEIPLRPGMKLGWFHLGADLDPIKGAAAAEQDIDVPLDRPLFVTVSTLEPRKCHAVALDAFDRLWARGILASYVIVGKEGWRSAALAQRIRQHPQYGTNLLWLDDATDADLRQIYRRAQALVFPSIDEGFGLPIIEAAYFGARLILSDIRIFHEIAGDEAQYFELLSAEALAHEIERCCGMERHRPQLETLSWRDAAQIVFKLLRDDPSLGERWITRVPDAGGMAQAHTSRASVNAAVG